MPGPKNKTYSGRQDRMDMADEAVNQAQQAAGLAFTIAGSLRSDGNSGDAWEDLSQQLEVIVDRMRKLAI